MPGTYTSSEFRTEVDHERNLPAVLAPCEVSIIPILKVNYLSRLDDSAFELQNITATAVLFWIDVDFIPRVVPGMVPIPTDIFKRPLNAIPSGCRHLKRKRTSDVEVYLRETSWYGKWMLIRATIAYMNSRKEKTAIWIHWSCNKDDRIGKQKRETCLSMILYALLCCRSSP